MPRQIVIEGELGTTRQITDEVVFAGFVELLALLAGMPPAIADSIAKGYRKTRRGRAYKAAADRAADLAYEHRVDADDQVIDDEVTDEQANLCALSAGDGHPLKGYALDVALGVLAYDRLDPDDWQTITELWRTAGAPLPESLPGRRPGRPAVTLAEDIAATRSVPPAAAARPAPARPAPAASARPARAPAGRRPGGPAVTPPPQPPAPAPVPVQRAGAEKAAMQAELAFRARVMKARRRLHRWSVALWLVEFPVFMGAAVLAGFLTSWVPLVIGLMMMVAIGVFAVVTGAKAGRQ